MQATDSGFAGPPGPTRRANRQWRRALIFLVAGLLLAPQSVFAASQTVIVRDGQGGGVVARARLIRRYQANGTHVEIRGEYCLSACTMYLTLATTCISPDTTFGFHGPSSRLYGIALNPAAFEYWSRVMADHYPEPLRSWFLTNGRHRTVGFHEFSGRDLIDMGVARCPRLTTG